MKWMNEINSEYNHLETKIIIHEEVDLKKDPYLVGLIINWWLGYSNSVSVSLILSKPFQDKKFDNIVVKNNKVKAFSMTYPTYYTCEYEIGLIETLLVNPKDPTGFGGRIITLEDKEGNKYELKGPWNWGVKVDEDCLAWGKPILQCSFGYYEKDAFFPNVCFGGMWAFGDCVDFIIKTLDKLDVQTSLEDKPFIEKSQYKKFLNPTEIELFKNCYYEKRKAMGKD